MEGHPGDSKDFGDLFLRQPVGFPQARAYLGRWEKLWSREQSLNRIK
ncbi:hypothetical protein ABZT48_32915 [Streptomyces avermitilis]